MASHALEEILQKSIFEVSELENLSEEKKQEIFEQSYETVMNRVMIRIADLLDEHGIDKLKELIDEADAGAVHQFFESNNIDIDQIASSEALAYKVELAALTDTLHGQSLAS
ncbi:MAG: hypothetical protein NUV80_03965 [Candidatus Berkelbacteria bacterium]|nr:hypothetical protein [Candidatus Berkelbacteria bacterium]MCR4307694.1 hypothetical protein [Candidatus Berkelbacteria bacterium]